MAFRDKAVRASDRMVQQVYKGFNKRYGNINQSLTKDPQINAYIEELGRETDNQVERILKRREAASLSDLLASKIVDANKKTQIDIEELRIDVFIVNREHTAESINIQLKSKVSFEIYDKNQIVFLLEEDSNVFTKIAFKQMQNNDAIVLKLRQELIEATMAGESQGQIIKRITNVTNFNKNRAKKIAQTERNTVQSQARQRTMNEAVENGVKVEKKWLTRMIRSRESHIDLNGKQIPAHEEFKTNLMHPGDPRAPADEIINCFCVVQPKVIL